MCRIRKGIRAGGLPPTRPASTRGPAEEIDGLNEQDNHVHQPEAHFWQHVAVSNRPATWYVAGLLLVVAAPGDVQFSRNE